MKFSSVILAGFVTGAASQVVVGTGTPYAGVAPMRYGASSFGPYARAPVVGARAPIVGARAPMVGGRVAASPYFGRAVAAPVVAAPVVAAPEMTEEEQEAAIAEAKKAWEAAQDKFDDLAGDIADAKFDQTQSYADLQSSLFITDADDKAEFGQLSKFRDLDDALASQNSARKKFAALKPSSTMWATRAASLKLQKEDANANNKMYSVLSSLNIGDLPAGETYPKTTEFGYIKEGASFQASEDAYWAAGSKLGSESADAAAYLKAKAELAYDQLDFDGYVAKVLGQKSASNDIALDLAFQDFDGSRSSYEKAWAANQKDSSKYNQHKLEIATLKLENEELKLTNEFMGYWGNMKNPKLGDYLSYKTDHNDWLIAKRDQEAILPLFKEQYSDLAESLANP